MEEVVLDCIGEVCPNPLVKAEKILNGLKKGDILIVQIDHICALKDIPEWGIKNGHNVEIREEKGEWEIIIEKVE